MPVWNADEGALAPLAVFNTGTFNLSAFLNGHVRGNLFLPAAGAAFTIIQERVPGGGGLVFPVPIDPVHPNFNYPFLVSILSPFVTFQVTNGANAQANVIGDVTAVPLTF
jgi:hypothetical protein